MNKRILFDLKLIARHDFPAGITVFFVALPLCLGIALASGAPLYAGLVSGFIGGLVVPPISKSVYGVSGPAAGLSTIVAAAILASGSYSIFITSVVIAGAFQVALGLLRVGGFVNYFPASVIRGMLTGIGLLIIGKQIPIAFGSDTAQMLHAFRASGMQGISAQFSLLPTTITVISVLLLLFWPKARIPYLQRLPAPLIAVAVAVLMGMLLPGLLPHFLILPQQIVNVPANLMSAMTFPAFGEAIALPIAWKNGLVIGIVATLETLLCAEAIDKLDPHKRTTPTNRELLAQGAGNAVSGLLGGLPMTAVIVRGSANIQAGAQSRASAVIHGLLLLGAVLFLQPLLNRIPYAALAAILILTGYGLAKPAIFRSLWRQGYRQFIPFIVTVMLVVGVDLLSGVAVGFLVAVYFIIQENLRTEYFIRKNRKGNTEVIEIDLHTNVTFFNKVALRRELEKAPEYSILRIDASRAQFIDRDVLEMISEFEIRAKDRHIQVERVGLPHVEVSAAH